MLIALLDHELLKTGDVVVLEAFFLNLGFLFVFHNDVLTICFFSLTFADDGTLEESATVVANACFLQEFVVHLEIHVEWVDSNH